MTNTVIAHFRLRSTGVCRPVKAGLEEVGVGVPELDLIL
jgi:hypothetical protein